MALIRWEPVPMNRLFNNLFDTPTVASAAGAPLCAGDRPDRVRDALHPAGRSAGPVRGRRQHRVRGQRPERLGRAQVRARAPRQGYYRVERSYGSFRRSLRLPEGVDAGAIKATFDKGVLEITVPKPEAAKPHKVQITVGGDESPAIEGGESTETAADEQVAA